MAEWLRRGLQILARRFDSGSGLHFCFSEGLRASHKWLFSDIFAWQYGPVRFGAFHQIATQ